MPDFSRLQQEGSPESLPSKRPDPPEEIIPDQPSVTDPEINNQQEEGEQ